jgi:DNA ligase (NAD+)
LAGSFVTENLYNSERTSWLADEIVRHKRLYYAGSPEISDLDYDRLETELMKLSPSHPVLKMIGGKESEPGNQKVTHDPPMLSLDKTYELKDLYSWANGRDVLGTLKVDGTSMSLVYHDGAFSLAKTRGNGREGEDVTTKLKWVTDAIPRIAEKLPFEVRGELYCSESNFVKLADEMVGLGLDRPSSPRNIVAGVLGRKIHGELARYFNFFAFDVIGLSGFRTEIQKVEWLGKNGFRLPNPQLLNSPQEIDRYLAHVKSLMEENEVGCDGAVFSYDNLALHNELGMTSHHPRFKISFKWQGQTARSKIVRIDWATSRLGIVTPVAVIEPVDLSGATITNITLHNASHVRGYNLKSGDFIEIVRSGEVIPKFLSVVTPGSGAFEWPKSCPSCGGELFCDDIRLKCPNQSGCAAQRSGAVLNWIRAVGIDDLSDKRLQSMMDLNLVKVCSDLYNLTVKDLLTLPSTKEKMAQKLFDNIQKSKILPLPMFLNGLGIEGAGQTTWEKLLEAFPSLEQIRTATSEKIAAVDGFAERSAKQIVDGLLRNSNLIDSLLTAGVSPVVAAVDSGAARPLESMIFVITGELERPRKAVEDMIKRAGGRVGSSVSKTTSVLITNETESSSSKMVKAKALGLEIWSENMLVTKISSHDNGVD